MLAIATLAVVAACSSTDQEASPSGSADPSTESTLVQGEDPVVVDRGVSPIDGDRTAWAVVIENPDPTLAVISSEVQIELLDDDGDVAEQTVELIGALPPGERTALAGTAQTADITDIRVEFFPIWSVLPPGFGTLDAIIDTLDITTSSVRLDGVIVSDKTESVFGVDVSVVFYDADDELLGGGLAFVESVPPNSDDSAFEYDVSGLPGVARVETFTNF